MNKREARRKVRELIRELASFRTEPICIGNCENCEFYSDGKCIITRAAELVDRWSEHGFR
mgnify:CR=1 FL=1